MPSIGPTLPPHLQARRKHSEDDDTRSFSSEATTSRCTSPPEVSKRRRVAGPAMPPAPLEERPPNPPGVPDSSSDDEDDYGPTLPASHGGADSTSKPEVSALGSLPAEVAAPIKVSKRDEWMTMPPKQDDPSARMDPTKIQARGFNTGKSAKGPKAGGSEHRMWTETPEQKRKRLQDEVLGVKPASSDSAEDDWKERAKRRRNDEKAQLIKDHNDHNRNESLYKQHKQSEGKEEADDPNKRGFNYERDMSSAPKINHAQKREMLNKAADFNSRFSTGSYL